MWLHICMECAFAFPPACHSLCPAVSLWTVISWWDKAFAGMSWHVCNLAGKHEWLPSRCLSPVKGQGIHFSSPPPACPSNPSVPLSKRGLLMRVCLPAWIFLNHHTSITPITSFSFCQVHRFGMINCNSHTPEGSCHCLRKRKRILVSMRVPILSYKVTVLFFIIEQAVWIITYYFVLSAI